LYMRNLYDLLNRTSMHLMCSRVGGTQTTFGAEP
jgi:hypothetical protein